MMNKKQYLDALEKALRQNNVTDVEDVLADYQAHFTRKALDGYTEAEIAHRLGNSAEIAADFLPEADTRRKADTVKGRGLIRAALCMADLFVLPFFLVLFLWAAALIAVSVGLLALGGYIALGLNVLSFIPVLPVAGGILTGVGIAALSVLLCAGSIWFLLLCAQMTRAYVRWHSNRWYTRHELALPVMPQITGKKRRNLRRTVVVLLILFVMVFAAGYIVMSVQVGTPEFWHYWHWFETASEVPLS